MAVGLHRVTSLLAAALIRQTSRGIMSSPLHFAVRPDYDWSKPTCRNYGRTLRGSDPATWECAGPYLEIRRTRDPAYHGCYVQSRQAMQDTMIRDVVKGGTSQCEPWLVFTAGAMGAGKSHVIQWMSQMGYFQLPSIVQVDPDRFRSRLPEWEGYLARDPLTAGAMTHRECGYCVEIAQEAALIDMKNLWVDGSLRDSAWYTQVIKDIRKRHPKYRIAILYVHASKETVFARAKRRAETTGRHVPEEELLNSLECTPRSVDALSKLVDFVAWVSNNDGDIPRFTKYCDETVCALKNGTDWTEVKERFAPIDLDEEAMRAMIDEYVSDKQIVLFTKSYCSFCAQVKAVFKDLGLKPFFIDLDQREDGLKIQLALNKKTGQSTTPQVFVRGTFLGGNAETMNAHKKGELHKLVEHTPCNISLKEGNIPLREGNIPLRDRNIPLREENIPLREGGGGKERPSEGSEESGGCL